MNIALDAMGSDACPYPEIIGAHKAIQKFNEDIYLVGPEDKLNEEIENLNIVNDHLHVVHSDTYITMEDKGYQLARKILKSNSSTSMAVGTRLLKDKKVDAFITAGNTGGAFVTARDTLGSIDGIFRPGLMALFPVHNGSCVVLDIGANPECRPDNILQFAIMGSVYANKVLQVQNPKVGMLSNGEEAGKGNNLVKEAYPLLESAELNFIGNLEPKELFGGEADVVVTDGFTGNVLLKSSEAVAKMMTDILRNELTSSIRNKMGALLAKPAFINLKKLLDPSEVGAAPLLGFNGLVFVGHGRSDSRAIFSAIQTARKAVEADLLEALNSKIHEALNLD